MDVLLQHVTCLLINSFGVLHRENGRSKNGHFLLRTRIKLETFQLCYAVWLKIIFAFCLGGAHIKLSLLWRCPMYLYFDRFGKKKDTWVQTIKSYEHDTRVKALGMLFYFPFVMKGFSFRNAG